MFKYTSAVVSYMFRYTPEVISYMFRYTPEVLACVIHNLSQGDGIASLLRKLYDLIHT